MCAKDVCGFAMRTPLTCGQVSLRLKPAAFRPVFSSEPFLGSHLAVGYRPMLEAHSISIPPNSPIRTRLEL